MVSVYVIKFNDTRILFPRKGENEKNRRQTILESELTIPYKRDNFIQNLKGNI